LFSKRMSAEEAPAPDATMATEEAAPAPGIRVRELRASFAAALGACVELPTAQVRRARTSRQLVPPRRRGVERETRATRRRRARAKRTNTDHAHSSTQEFIRAFPGLNPAHHEPLYDLYANLLKSIKEHAEREFDDICLEEAVEARLNAIDALCAERGVVDLDVAANASRVVYSGKSPDEVARNTRAEAKRKEAETLREEAATLELEAQEKIAELESKREAVRAAANGLKTGAQGGDVVHEASMQWSSRAPVKTST